MSEHEDRLAKYVNQDRDWIADLANDPDLLMQAAEDWSVGGNAVLMQLKSNFWPTDTDGFYCLSRILTLICDTEKNGIDPTDWFVASETLSEMKFVDPEETEGHWAKLIESIERGAIAAERLRMLANYRAWSKDRKRKGGATGIRNPDSLVSKQRIDAVREIVRDDPFATQDAIQRKLSCKSGAGYNRDVLKSILDQLRDEGIYKVPSRSRGNSRCSRYSPEE